MIRTSLPAAALLLLTLLAPSPAPAAATAAATAAAAAGETCRGEIATLVGAPQTLNIRGTEGRDVVVTNGSQMLEALGGDDLICVTRFGSQVFAGDGDDLVDATMLGEFGTAARLGAGSDRFEGGAGRDNVWAGTEDAYLEPAVDAERDVILTGPPNSSIYNRDSVESGQRGVANDDEIRMGSGFLGWAGIPTAATIVDGGAGSHLGVRAEASDSVALDNIAGTLAVDTQPLLRFTGFTGFSLTADGPDAFSFRGSARDEQLHLELRDAPRHSVQMGGGDDDLRFYSSGTRTIATRTSYDGGAGRDTLDLTVPDEVDVDLDLARGRVSTGRRASEVTTSARRFEDAAVAAQDVEIVGTGGRNKLSVYACRSTVEGRGGRDTLSTFDQVMDYDLPCSPRARLLGGGGNDDLTGSRGPDRLLGGPGRDKVDGDRGRDVCQGERLRRCEVRR